MEKTRDPVFSLQELCQLNILKHIKEDNCIGFWKLSVSLPSKTFIQATKQIVLNHFDDFGNNLEFLELSVLELIEIIKDDDLNTKREENVFEIVMKWFHHNTEDRMGFLSEVLQHIRFPLMRPDYLLYIHEEFPVLHENKTTKELLFEALRYRDLGGRRHEMTSLRTLHRQCSKHSNVVVAISNDGNCSAVEYQANKWQSKWKPIKPLPFVPGYFFAVTTFLDDIYVTGGMAYNASHAAKYNSEQDNWRLCCKMPVPRARHAMVSVNRAIFTLGGSTPTEEYVTAVDKYDISRQKWTNFGNLLFPVRSMSAAVLRENIYICGGKIKESGKECNYIQCFHSQTAQCSLIGNLLRPISLSSALPIEGSIFIVSHDGIVMKISRNYENEIVREYCRFRNFHMNSISAVCINNNLYVMTKVPSTEEKVGQFRNLNLQNNTEIDRNELYPINNNNERTYTELFKYTLPKRTLKSDNNV